MAIIQTKGIVKRSKRAKTEIEFASFYGGIRNDVVESVLPVKYANKMCNFCIKNGALTTGLGISTLSLPSYSDSTVDMETLWYFDWTPHRLYLFRAYNNVRNGVGDRLFVYSSAGKLSWTMINSTIGQYMTLPDLTLNEAPEDAINYTLVGGEDVLLFGSSTDTLTIWGPHNNLPTAITDAPKITSLCSHYERMFATVADNYTAIWFSDDLDPTNWSVNSEAGGYINLADKLYGGANKIISFNNYLYVIRDYGITRISAYASQESFSVQHIYASSNLIYADTACVCGDVIYFMATDGFYAFDGVNVVKVNVGFEKMLINLNQSKSRATFYKNKYCIILNTDLSEQKDDYLNTLITYDITSGEYDILSGYYFQDILGVISDEVERLVVIVYNENATMINEVMQVDESGQVFGLPTKKTWESAFTDLGYSNYEKCLTRISLQTKTDCTVTVETEKETVCLAFSGSSKVQSKKINISGVMVKLKFECNQSECEISHPIIEFSLGKPNSI